MSIRCAVFDRHVLAVDDANLAQTLPESIHQRRWLGGSLVKESYRRKRLLRARSERPRHRAAEASNELAPVHSITSSARARIESGIVSPIAFAVLRLMTMSNFVACSTGRSAGLAPLKILSTKYAARRYIEGRFSP